ncbi:TPA: hypothetical protein ACIVB1_001820 [Salmonella enterica subsp. diarizonae serovar 61:l,v:z35]
MFPIRNDNGPTTLGCPAVEKLDVRWEKSVPLMASLNIWWREKAAVMSSA